MGASSAGSSAGSYSRSASWITITPPVAHHPVEPPLPAQAFEDVARAVGGGIVDGDELDSQRDAAQARDDARHGVSLVIDGDEDAESHASFDSPSYRLSFRYRVEGSMPRTSAARVLLPPSLWSTHVM